MIKLLGSRIRSAFPRRRWRRLLTTRLANRRRYDLFIGEPALTLLLALGIFGFCVPQSFFLVFCLSLLSLLRGFWCLRRTTQTERCKPFGHSLLGLLFNERYTFVCRLIV